jgi:diguanylate cyclase (GGDEF)-like protein
MNASPSAENVRKVEAPGEADGHLSRSRGGRWSWHPWSVAVLVGLVLIVVYFTLPAGSAAQSVGYNVIGLAAVVTMMAGVRLNRPVDRVIWWLFAAGTFLSVVADSVGTAYLAMGKDLPMPSVADVIYLASYPCFFVAVARLDRSVRGYSLRERHIDAAIIALGAFVISWQFLMGSYAHDSAIDALGKLTLMSYPIMDIALFYVVLSAMLFGLRREPVDRLIGLALGVMLAGDFAYDLLELHGAYTNGDVIDVTWLLNYVLLAVAALHPSMVAVGSRRRVATPPRRWWIVMVGSATTIVPIILLVTNATDAPIDLPVVAGVALLMAAIAAVRMTWSFDRLAERTSELRQRTESLQQALSQRDALEDDLRHQAFHDTLTGLANRALLQERTDHALRRASRDHASIALVMCDLDGFKSVNDSLGHPAGDLLLGRVAERLVSVVRPGDTVARLGGDEFAILLDGFGEPAAAVSIVERIIRVVREPADISGRLITVSASAGIRFATSRDSSDEMFRDADAAMYEAKSRGKNRYITFDPSMRSRAVERMRLASAFVGAIERGEFLLQFQPSFGLVDGRLTNFEALVRWQHPTLGLVAPDRFISLAEETGFIVPLGRWVLRTACMTAAAWPAAIDGTPTLSVNISASQFRDADLIRDVREALSASGLPPTRLVLEITEGMLINEPDRTVSVLNKLRRLGIRVGIDDFGTGYSSLSEVRQFSVDFVKIDKTFVDRVGDDDEFGRAITRSIVDLAHNFDLKTVAEGIEVASQRDALQRMGCDSGQGYLLSRPMDAGAAAALAARHIADRLAEPVLS